MKALESFFLSIYRNKRAFIGFIILCIFIFAATAGTFLVKLDTTTHFMQRYQSPSWQHLLGTDNQGRDTFALLVHGSQDVLLIGVFGATFTVLFGFTLGALAGFAGGIVDHFIDFLTNLFMTLPQLPVLLVLSAFIKVSSPLVLALIIGFMQWAFLARPIRAQILSLKSREFITVCRVMGFSLPYILFVEILPNLISYIAMQFILTMQTAIILSSMLIMLGFAPFSVTHWGTLMASSQAAAAGAFDPKTLVYLFSPMLCFTLLSTSCVLFASGLDEALNPRLRAH